MFLSKILRGIDHPYLKGRGAREFNNELHHLNMAFFRHQKGLAPLFLCGFGGCIFVMGYIGSNYALFRKLLNLSEKELKEREERLALKTTDVNWTKERDLDIVHSRYENKEFKFMNPGGYDHSQLNVNRPSYRE